LVSAGVDRVRSGRLCCYDDATVVFDLGGPVSQNYKVVVFLPSIDRSVGAEGAARELESLINAWAQQGWTFKGLESVEMQLTTAGTSGCLGFGAVPATSSLQTWNMAVFVTGS
jgi:hypothetical protein